MVVCRSSLWTNHSEEIRAGVRQHFCYMRELRTEWKPWDPNIIYKMIIVCESWENVEIFFLIRFRSIINGRWLRRVHLDFNIITFCIAYRNEIICLLYENTNKTTLIVLDLTLRIPIVHWTFEFHVRIFGCSFKGI